MAAPDHRALPLSSFDGIDICDFRCAARRGSDGGDEVTRRYEIVFPRRGSFLRSDHRGQVVGDANRILFCNPDEPYRISHPNDGGDRSTVVGLEPTTWQALFPAVERLPAAMPATSADQLDHSELMRRLARGADPLEISEATLHLLRRLLSRLPHGKEPNDHTSSSGRELVRRTELALSGSPGRQLTLTMLAREVYSSPFHLSRVFRQETGLPLFAYLRRLRVHQSLEPLLEGTEPIGAVGMRLGFASPSHFSTAFKRQTGLTPSEFRRSASRSSRWAPGTPRTGAT